MEYKRSNGEHFRTGFKQYGRASWTPTTVTRILTNEIYLGTMVQGKTQRPNYKVHTPLPKSAEDWVRVDGTHEPIIGKGEFETVGKLLLRDTRTAPMEEFINCRDRDFLLCETLSYDIVIVNIQYN